MSKSQEFVQNVQNVIEECYDIKRKDAGTSANVLSSLLFNLNPLANGELVKVRDYDTIKKDGAFKYAGQRDTMFEEGLMPEDVYKGLEKLGIDRHIGPSYLKVKGLLTLGVPREFFGKHLAAVIMDYLEKYLAENPAPKEGYVVCLPNMTGGAWIGDETRRILQAIMEEDAYLKDGGLEVWPGTPYMREMRKVTEVVEKGAKFKDFVEGPFPTPEETAVIVDFEELVTAAETTRNALRTCERFGYDKENEVKLVAASVFNYKHPVGMKRLENVDADVLYVVDGNSFFDAAKNQGHITDAQYVAVNEWLANPWAFTRKVIPDLEKIMVK